MAMGPTLRVAQIKQRPKHASFPKFRVSGVEWLWPQTILVSLLY
jgi:hypothetical protein